MKRLSLLSSILVALLVAEGFKTVQGQFGQAEIDEINRIANERIKNFIENDFEEEFRRRIDIDAEVQKYIDDLDIGQEFKDLTGVSIGSVIAVFIVIIIVPNLVILGLIFLFCFCCKCGVFGRGGGSQDRDSYGKAPQAQPSQYQARGPVATATTAAVNKPEVPARPTGLPMSQNAQQSGSAWPRNFSRQGSQTPEPSKPVWPWNNSSQNQNAANNNPTGHQNPNYKSQW